MFSKHKAPTPHSSLPTNPESLPTLIGWQLERERLWLVEQKAVRRKDVL